MKAVVIGSGMGGLTSAVLLATHGYEVDVLEQHYRAGGYLHRFFRDGVGYDTGFHYVGSAAPNQLFGRVLRHLGVYDRVRLLPLDPDGFDLLRFPDLDFLVPEGLDRFKDRLLAMFPHERAGLDRYVAMHRAAVKTYGLYNLDTETPPEAILPWEERSVESVLRECFADERLRAVMLGQVALYGVPPWDAPFGLHAIVTDHFLQGAYAIEGGGDKLALALVKRLRELGGRIHLKTPATSVEVTDGHATAVFSHDERFPADLVIANIHPKRVLELLPTSAVRPAYQQRVAAARPGLGHIGLYMRIQGDLSTLYRRNLYLYRSWDIPSLAEPARPGNIPFLFLTAPGWRERKLPGVEQVVLGLVQANTADFAQWRGSAHGDRPAAYEDYKDGVVESVVGVLHDQFPDWKFDHVEASTPLSTEHFTRSPEGATYGHYHAVSQMGRYRLPMQMRVRGLLQVGQCTGFPGICGAAMSAYAALGNVLGPTRLVEELRG